MQFTFEFCELSAVIDADTLEFKVLIDHDTYRIMRVRLEGLDAPEKSTPEGSNCRANMVIKTAKFIPVSEYSKKRYFKVITSNKNDKYGRRLGTVIDPDGNDINAWSLKENNCVPYDGGKKGVPVKEDSPKV